MLITFIVILGFTHLLYWWLIFGRLILHTPSFTERTEGVSVIASAKNEEQNIRPLIGFLQSQNYPALDITIIDDYSSDGTSEILQSIKDIRLIRPSNDVAGKKLGLTEGIETSAEEFILLTDADCKGNSTEWVKCMMGVLKEGDIVIGYAPLRDHGNLASLFAAYETWLTGVQYLSYALARIPYMGVGRNLLFSKNAFLRNNGYSKHVDLVSGDDDLLINEIAHGNNTAVCIDRRTFMYSDAPQNWRQLFNQKRRHLSTATRYRPIHKWMLSVFSFSHIAFYTSLLGMLVYGYTLWVTVIIWMVKVILQMVIAMPIMIKLEEQRLLPWYPVFDVILFLYYVIMAPFTIIKSKKHWS